MKQYQNVQSETEEMDSLNSADGAGGGGRSRTVSEVDSLTSMNTTTTTATTSSPRSSKIFLYSKAAFESIQYDSNEVCEDVCLKICRLLQFKPTVVLLFGLRMHNSNCFLPGCRNLEPNVQYEFRVRFKVSSTH